MTTAPKAALCWGRSCATRAAACAIFELLLGSAALAVEPYLEFLDALERRGYGEMAVDYLNIIKERDDLPAEVREVWDLEMAESLRVGAAEAPNREAAEQRLQESKRYLDRFGQQHPHHPAVAASINASASLAFDQGLKSVRQGEQSGEQAARDKLFAQARTAFDRARAGFRAAIEYLGAANASATSPDTADRGGPAPVDDASRHQQAAADNESAEARTKLALIDYWWAHTLATDGTAPNDAQRQALSAAIKQFGEIATELRGTRAAFVAQYWQARATAELGDLEMALDVCDEVLGFAPEFPEDHVSEAEENFFAEALIFRWQLLRQQGHDEQVLAEAGRWLKPRAPLKATAGYQGVTLELVKSQLAAAEKLLGKDRHKARQASLKLLEEVAHAPGPYQLEALKLDRAQRSGDPHHTEGRAELNELLELATLAADGLRWAEAEDSLQQALRIARADAAAPIAPAEIEGRIAELRLRDAILRLRQDAPQDAISILEKIVRELPETATAPRAAALAVSTALRRYAMAPDSERSAAYQRLRTLANMTIEQWPDRPESDDALIALGQAAAASGDDPAAIALFRKVRQQSPRYAYSLFAAGQQSWRSYLVEKAKTQKSAKPDVIERLARDAETSLRASIERATGTATTTHLADARLLLAQICLERDESAEALAILTPLLAELEAGPKPAWDLRTLRLCQTGVRAQLESGQHEEAVKLAGLLATTGEDEQRINAVLLDMIVRILKRNPVPEDDVEGGHSSQAAWPPAVIQLVRSTSERKQFSPQCMLFLADACALVGAGDRSRELYQAVLERAQTDKEFAQQSTEHLMRARARLVGLLRDARQYEPALKQVNALLADHPGAIDLMLEKGRILQSFADADPRRLDEAIAHWTAVRRALASLPTRGPDYFDAVYYAALGLYRQGRAVASDEKFQQAEQLLKATLVIAPKLSGEKMVAQYQELLERVSRDRPKKAGVQRQGGETATPP